MNYVTAGEAKKRLKITPITLMKWKDSGIIKYKRLSKRKILYDLDSIGNDSNEQVLNKKNVVYARVSTSGQKTDLENQIEVIKNYMLSNGIKPDEIYSDIASGMNENRKEFNNLLESVFRREVGTIYITFKDRLSRFGFNYFKSIFSFFGTTIVILDENEGTNKTYQQELMEDLLAIIHTYSMKLYTSRKKKLKQIESILKDKDASDENC